MCIEFDDASDDVPLVAAGRVGGIAHTLLDHADSHAGAGRVTFQLTRSSGWLNLWVTDSECSPDCVQSSGQMSAIAGVDRARGDERVSVFGGREGGVILHWSIALPPYASMRPI